MALGANGLAPFLLWALAVSLLPGTVEDVQDKVVAREFVLVDAEGKLAARLGMGPYEEPILTFFHPRGSQQNRLELGLGAIGAPFVNLSDSGAAWTDNGVDLRLSVEGEPGEPVIVLSRKEEDSADAVRLRLGIGYDLKPSIILSTPTARKTLSIESAK